jgi:hypothetical protein
MLKRFWDWLHEYSDHLKGLAALLTIISLIAALGAKSLSHWLSGRALIVTVQRDNAAVAPDLLEWAKGLASQLPVAKSGLERSWLGSEHGPKPNNGTASSSAYDIVISGDRAVAKSLEPYWNPDFLRKIRTDTGSLGRLILTLENPSSTAMQHINISIDGIGVGGLWGVYPEGTFLAADEAKRIELGVIRNTDQCALPEMSTLPPRGKIKLTFYGDFWYRTEPQVSVDGADVRLVETLALQENWFLDIYQSPLSKGVGYGLLLALAFLVLELAVPAILNRKGRQASR